jgi:membrane associated rhomboid family serine protease
MWYSAADSPWIRAYVALILWILYQLFLAITQMAALSRMSAMAHLGGAGVGFLFWLWLKTPAEILTSGKPINEA